MEPVGPLARISRAVGWFHRIAFWSIGAVLILSPWLFAAWERWWFWPMTALIFLGAMLSGAALMAGNAIPDVGEEVSRGQAEKIPFRALLAGGLCLPFIVYALIRAQFPSAPGFPLVKMAAERSLLLFITPLLLATVVAISGTERRRGLMVRILFVNAALLATYGFWNHWATGDSMRLWINASEYKMAYEGRLSSTFYCPNHFSAWLNIVICLLAGAALARRPSIKILSLCFALGAYLLLADFRTLSRGGMASLFIALCILIPVIGLRGRKAKVRAVFAGAVVVAFVCAGSAVLLTDNPLMERLGRHSVWSLFEPTGEQKVPLELGRDGFAATFGFRAKESSAGPQNLSSQAIANGGREYFFTELEKAPRWHAFVRISSDGTNLVFRSRAWLPGTPSSSDIEQIQVLCKLPESSPEKKKWDAAALALRDAEWQESLTAEERSERLHDAFWYSFDRGQYIGAALRAWRSNPFWGIGPGQHSDRWAQFEPTDEGRRPSSDDPTACRPAHMDYNKHLYEVHSDWTQLLEEYGQAGLTLFLIPFFGIFAILFVRHGEASTRADGSAIDRGIPLGAILAGAVLTVHSTFDFSLQLPAVNWLLAFVVVSGILSRSGTHRAENAEIAKSS